MKSAEKLIPKGDYCYERLEPVQRPGQAPRLAVISRCPFHRVIKGRPQQESGYCLYLQAGDTGSQGTFLLWDMVKECGINKLDDDYELEVENYV